ncbi:DUF4873 domain-containing protein [Antrihabitans cavernicola]|uniref:DUF4873 domain-containing protein n=1 Tax=Antrihabitans cavernicola TaxID=2495913 RepID=A0A5A7S9Z4_9NOCA|nr:DUF4873 domain-containing protein [Spelaeibacter cavernicola]KAA0022304.1 DUF4873 domain-containing protein [Spelaeibacter cavernicola]
MSDDDAPDGYSGTAEVTVGSHAPVTVRVELAGNFDPIVGKFRWHGRLRELAAAVSPAPEKGTEVSIATPDGVGTAVVTHVDLWGSHMVDGVSEPPFPVFAP